VIPTPEPKTEPKPEPRPEPKTEPKPEPKPELKPGELKGRSRMDLIARSYDTLVKELEHYEDTPAEVKEEIEKLCVTLVDYNAGRAQLDAQKRLTEIGRHAIPKVVTAYKNTGAQDSHEGMVNTIIVQDTLLAIVGNPWKFQELKQFARPDKKTIRKVVKWWFVWWYVDGHKAKEFKKPDEEEEEEE
jgi:hypothetical protein